MNLHLQGSVYRIYTCRVHVVVVQTEDASRSRADSPSCLAARRGRKGHIGNDFLAFSIPISSALAARGVIRGYRAGHPPQRDSQCWARRRPCSGRAPPPRRRGRFGTRASPRWLSDPLPPSADLATPRVAPAIRAFSCLSATFRAMPRHGTRAATLASRRDHPAYRPEPSDDARLSPPAQDARRSLTAHFSAPPLHPRVVSVSSPRMFQNDFTNETHTKPLARRRTTSPARARRCDSTSTRRSVRVIYAKQFCFLPART